jgi:hypothetical protein
MWTSMCPPIAHCPSNVPLTVEGKKKRGSTSPPIPPKGKHNRQSRLRVRRTTECGVDTLIPPSRTEPWYRRQKCVPSIKTGACRSEDSTLAHLSNESHGPWHAWRTIVQVVAHEQHGPRQMWHVERVVPLLFLLCMFSLSLPLIPSLSHFEGNIFECRRERRHKDSGLRALCWKWTCGHKGLGKSLHKRKEEGEERTNQFVH